MNSFHETHDDGLDPSNKLQTGLLPNPGSSQITPYTDFKPFLEKRRWFILIGYAGFSLTSAIIWIVFAPILQTASDYFHQSDNAVLQLGDCYFYVIVLTILPVMATGSDHFAFHLLLATACNSLAGWMRVIGGPNYWLALTGSILGGFCSSGLFVCLPLVAERWFAESERGWAIVIGNLSNYIGWAIGYIYSPLYMASQPDLGSGFRKLFLQQAIIVSIPTIILILSVRNRPKMPPSHSEHIKRVGKKYNTKETIIALWKNKPYFFSVITFGTTFGAALSVSTVTAYILKPLDLDSYHYGYIGMSYLGLGCLGAIVATIILEINKKLKYDSLIKGLIAFGFIGLVLMAILGKSIPFWGLLIVNGFAGIGFISYAPFAIESLLETSFPIPETFSIGAMYLISQLTAAFFSFITTVSWVGHEGYWVLAGLYLPFVIYVLFFFKTRYRGRNKDSFIAINSMKSASSNAVDAAERPGEWSDKKTQEVVEA